MAVGQPLVLADQTPDTAASPAASEEADQMHQARTEAMDTTQFTGTRNAAGPSHLHKEIRDYPRVHPYQPTRHGMDRNPTELTGEMIVEINSDKVVQHPDQGIWTLMFRITAAMTAGVIAAMIAREIQVDVITAGILHQEGGVAVPASETGVEVRIMMSSDVLT